MSKANQTPLLDLLGAVPADARMVYEHSPVESQSIPVGRLCAEAAATIAALRAEVERLERDAELLDWLDGEEGRELKAKLENKPFPRSLFRSNMPITRDVIRAAIASKERA